MNNNFLSKNIELLQKTNPELASQIIKLAELKADFQFLEAQSGDIILSKNGIPVHSELDPVEEAIKIVHSLENNTKESITIVYGIGMGYLLKRFGKNCHGQVVLYEPDLEFLRLAFELVDFSEELSNKKIHIANTYKQLEKLYENIFFKSYQLNLAYLDYHKHYETDAINTFMEQISALHGIYESNYKNLFEKTRIWVHSTLRDLPQIAKYQDLHVLKNKFLNKPAIIISAGPSLDKNIEEIKPFRDKVLVFCVGTALKTVLKHGIKPDFLVIVEIWQEIMNQVKGIDLSDTHLILQTMAYPGLYKDVKTRNKFNYYVDNDNLNSYLAKQIGVDLKPYKNMGTVAINALFSAKMMGCNPITLIGQDLAFSEGRCYSKDSIYKDFKYDEQSNNVFVEDFEKTKENINEDTGLVNNRLDYANNNLFSVKGLNGEQIKTRGDYAIFIKYFEQIAQDYGKEVQLINATEGGAYLEGFEHTLLKDTLEKFAKEPINAKEKIPVDLLERKETVRRLKIFKRELQNNLTFFKELYEVFEKCLHAKETEVAELIKTNSMKYFAETYPELFNDYLNLQKELYVAVRNKIFDNKVVYCFMIEKVLKIENIIKTYENKIEDDVNLMFNFRALFADVYFFYYLNGELKNLLQESINEIDELIQSYEKE